METSQIEELMKLMQSYGFNELEVEKKDSKIKLVQHSQGGSASLTSFVPNMPSHAPQSFYQPSPASPSYPKPAESQEQASSQDDKVYKEVRSPFVGTFYASSSPGGEPFAEVGKKIKRGDTLCIVEAMKLMNEIESDCEGTVIKVCVKNEEPVEYDQVLFLVE